jgi:hypothetical protein
MCATNCRYPVQLAILSDLSEAQAAEESAIAFAPALAFASSESLFQSKSNRKMSHS